jgi:hypothetical protein
MSIEGFSPESNEQEESSEDAGFFDAGTPTEEAPVENFYTVVTPGEVPREIDEDPPFAPYLTNQREVNNLIDFVDNVRVKDDGSVVWKDEV